jgi:hypothetical protein
VEHHLLQPLQIARKDPFVHREGWRVAVFHGEAVEVGKQTPARSTNHPSTWFLKNQNTLRIPGRFSSLSAGSLTRIVRICA